MTKPRGPEPRSLTRETEMRGSSHQEPPFERNSARESDRTSDRLGAGALLDDEILEQERESRMGTRDWLIFARLVVAARIARSPL